MKNDEVPEKNSILKTVYERYVINAMSSMALGLFATLIVGVLLTQIAKIPTFLFLEDIAKITQEKYIIGAAIGVAIAYGFKNKPLVIFSCAVVGALGYSLGGPLGAYIPSIFAAEIGKLVASKTPIDIILTPITTIVSGGLVATFASPFVGQFTIWLGEIVNQWATLQPFMAGVLIALVVGMSLTSPISSAGLCASIGITGIASGAALVGCTAQMVGFAVASYRDNGVGGLVSQGLGTSKIQLPNVLRHPQIWIAPSIASAIMGPISTCIFKLETSASAAAGMGTCGLVGPISAFDKMGYSVQNVFIVLMICIVIPAIIAFVFDKIFFKMGLVKAGQMKLTV